MKPFSFWCDSSAACIKYGMAERRRDVKPGGFFNDHETMKQKFILLYSTVFDQYIISMSRSSLV